MATVKELAQYLVYSYEDRSGSKFQDSELKLQKMMYLAQRESLAFTDEPLFNDTFEGWKYGPVLPSLRYFFDEDYQPFDPKNESNLTNKEIYIIDNVIAEYGKFEPWALAELTHNELCWLKSRNGLDESDIGWSPISTDDIREDAKKVRLYDHEYDMYVDEFEDFDDEVLQL
ncbi:DUF4065 domain-containing protein [Tetragenococcus halophilus]|uniref:DUF4065 domain-containing protein n=1 Tax=Tetragenococcus halophilus TaxID=51669 RepID=A0A3G5FKH9_TETHA|nr:type II toxin-antitoxin system antitoxin SocA domain-containing protein [Tetragenococcus halophilus]AYW50781.1 DUF4065 domain-containing protein [Tetragenococcus halophilus]GBD64863.1 hypothetical protein TEHD23766T_2290 [Tetragenococcus halophilus subsp. flandriensis]GMA08883.1 hypothetical protein GCM10025886_20340 [Tetragenococcus halophilus subsp. flandriensis]